MFSLNSRVAAVEADSSTSAVLIKVEPDRQPTTEYESKMHVFTSLSSVSSFRSSLNHSFAKNLQMSSSRSFESLSFEKLLNDFVSYFRDLLDNRSREPVLIEFFGSICTLRGLASIVLDRLKRDIETSDTKQHSLYAEGLEKIDKVTRSVQVLLELNKMKMHSYPILLNSFAQFQKNFKVNACLCASQTSILLCLRFFMTNGPIRERKLARAPLRRPPLVQVNRHHPPMPVFLHPRPHRDTFVRTPAENNRELSHHHLDDHRPRTTIARDQPYSNRYISASRGSLALSRI